MVHGPPAPSSTVASEVPGLLTGFDESVLAAGSVAPDMQKDAACSGVVLTELQSLCGGSDGMVQIRNDSLMELPLRRLLHHSTCRDHFPTQLSIRKAVAQQRVWIDGELASRVTAEVVKGAIVAYKVTSYVHHIPGASTLCFEAGRSGSLLTVLEEQAQAVVPTSTARNHAVKKGLVLVDGVVATSRTQEVPQGARIECLPQSTRVVAYQKKLEVLYEDDAIAVVVKEPGLLMDSVSKRAGRLTLSSVVAHNLRPTSSERPLRPPAAVHRLDCSVGGIVACAKTESAARELCAAFRERRVLKTYRAIVAGKLEPQSGVIETPVDGRASRTVYKTLRSISSLRFGHLSELELHPHTGRRHQLRIHLASFGHPIVDDKRYGADRARAGSKRNSSAIYLWAWKLRLPPLCDVVPEGLDVEAPSPAKFQRLWHKEAEVWRWAMERDGLEHIPSEYVRQLKQVWMDAQRNGESAAVRPFAQNSEVGGEEVEEKQSDASTSECSGERDVSDEDVVDVVW